MKRLYPVIGRYFAQGTPELAEVMDPDQIKARLDAPFDLGTLASGLATQPFVAQHP